MTLIGRSAVVGRVTVRVGFMGEGAAGAVSFIFPAPPAPAATDAWRHVARDPLWWGAGNRTHPRVIPAGAPAKRRPRRGCARAASGGRPPPSRPLAPPPPAA